MTLAQITHEARIILKVGGAATVVVVFLFLIFQGGSFIQKTFFPTPLAAPEKKFGDLSVIKFPENISQTPEYRVNTVSGVLPTFSSQVKVYKLVKNPPKITALPTARQNASQLGYSQNEIQINSDTYRWSNSALNSFLLYNIISLNFSINSDYLTQSNFVSGDITSTEDLIKTATDFIEALGANYSDVDFGKSSYKYFVSSNNNLVEVPTQTNATFAKISLIQNPVDGHNIYYPTIEPSILTFTIGNNGSLIIVNANYNHFAPDLSSSSTYPIKSTQNALQDLKDGKGYIVNSETPPTVDITDVSLGYYLNNESDQNFLIPIFVFTGKNNFVAYVRALSN